MGRRFLAPGVMFMFVAAAAACSGNPPPETEPVPEQTTPVNTEPTDPGPTRESEADRLCERAMLAMDEGNYATARELLQQVVDDYPGTSCAQRSATLMARAEALEAITARIHFDFNLAEITSESAAILQRKADALQAHPDVMITIEGHCDERGSLEYNQALGLRRAEAARQYLVRLGVSDSRFRTVSFGEERPLTMGTSESAYAQNRRDEFRITAGDI